MAKSQGFTFAQDGSRRAHRAAMPSNAGVARRSRNALTDVSNDEKRRRTRSRTRAEKQRPLRRSARLSMERESQSASREAAVPNNRRASSRGRSKTEAGRKSSSGVGDAAAQSRSRSREPRKKPARGSSKRARKDDSGAEQRKRPRKAARRRTRSEAADASVPHHNLVVSPFDSTKYTAGISVYDKDNRDDVLMVPEYAADIFQRLYKSETCNLIEPYIHNQRKVNETMRAILVDWLVEVHAKFRLEPVTLYLCVNIVDRYLSLVQIDRSRLQLVGITALLLASKYEDIYPPDIKDCVYVADRSFTRQDVIDMEEDILRELDFNLTVPTAYPFLQRFLCITKASRTMEWAASYYLDRVLQEYGAINFRPSLLAAAAVCLALNHPEIREHDDVEEEKPGVPKELLDYTGYSHSAILEAAAFVAEKVSEGDAYVSNRNLYAVRRKYKEARYEYVSVDFEVPDEVDLLTD